MRSTRCLVYLTLCCTVAITACAGGESFATRPGFMQYFKLYPPNPEPPDKQQFALLEQYRPRIYLHHNQQGPVDFYQQYINNGELEVAGRTIDQPLTRQLLNRYTDNPDALFTYKGAAEPGGPAVVYARFDKDTLTYQQTSYPLQFLTYNLTFPTSGMLVSPGRFNTALLSIAGDLTDWHQLDHYVGLSIALYKKRPVAVMLQQHNYQTTYVFNEGFTLPADNRIKIDIAIRSNEVYLHNSDKVEHPAVSFITKDNIAFLMTGNDKPFMAGFDVTHGEKEIDYRLETLPQTDAFYQFKGRLGESRLLPGRDGPPGADYATLPGLMPRAIRLVTGFRTESQPRETEKIAALFNAESFTINAEAIETYTQDFLDALSLPED